MDSEFNKIKDQFGQNDPNVPKHLDWDKMQEGIFSKMDRITQEELVPNDGRFKERSLLLLLVFLLLGIGVSVSLIEKDDLPFNETVPSEEALAENEKGKPITQIIDEKVLKKDVEAKTLKTILTKDIPETDDRLKSSDSSKDLFPTRSNSSSSSDDQKRGVFGMNGNSENRTDQSDNQVITAVEDEITNLQKGTNFNKKSVQNLMTESKRETISLALLSTRQGHLQHSPVFIEAPLLTYSPKDWKDENPRHKLGLFLGQSFWDMAYGENSPERAPFEMAKRSFNAHIQYQYKLDKGFFLSTGLVFQNMQSRLDWSKDLNDYSITLEDVVLEVRKDVLTGEVEEVRGDVDVQVTAERNVRHHNPYRLVQLPFAVGRKHSISTVDWSYSLGVALNLFSRNEGRILYQGDIVDLEEVEAEILDNQLKWNGFIGTSLSYYLSPRIEIATQVQYQRSLSNWSLEEAVRMRPQQINWSLGLIFTLD